MTTLTFYIPDAETASVAEIIKKKGGTLLVQTKEKLSKKEQRSLNKALDEAHKIKTGEITALTFDDLWDE